MILLEEQFGVHEELQFFFPTGCCKFTPTMTTVQLLIDKFALVAHPEGGWYKETYRSDTAVSVGEPPVCRSSSTAIYFLICPGNVSRLHRILSDEIWHFYLGSPLKVVEIGAEFPEHYRETTLGTDIAHGQLVQYMVKKGTWFGCYPHEGLSVGPGPGPGPSSEIYSFVGCTVAPGFEFSDFELASRAHLLSEFPRAEQVIVKLTEGLP